MVKVTQPIQQALLKPRINYARTWANIVQLLKNPAPIRPGSLPDEVVAMMGKTKVQVPRLKGNVLHTMKEIVNIYLAAERRATKVINVAIYTTRTSLAKRCGNLDPKTAYRHILALTQHGFLRGKVHVKAGLQLLINPALLVYDASAVPPSPAAQKPVVAPEKPLFSPAEALANLRAMAEKFAQNGLART